MPDYRIRPDGFKEIRKQILQRLVAVALVVVSFIIAMTIYNAKGKEDYIITLPITIVLFTVIFGFSIRRTFKKQKELLDSYALTINDNAITIPTKYSDHYLISYRDQRNLKNKGEQVHN